METKLQALTERLHEINDIQMARSVLYWDQATYMPPGGAPARARQMATLTRLAHEKFSDPVVGSLLEDLRPYEDSLPYDSDERSLIRVARREYERTVKVPASLMEEFSTHTAMTYQAWTVARPANDFEAVRPYLEKTLDLSRRRADFFPGYDHIADPLIDLADEGMRVAVLRPLFAELRAELLPMVQAVVDRPAADNRCLHQFFPEADQIRFGLEVIEQFGYDFHRGRQDKTPHPFMTKFGRDDVRITTRVKEYDLSEALFGTLHESGHGMYEQGVRPELDRTPLARGATSGMHESQSRLWENLVGRSRRFWHHFYPQLQAVFPDQLGSVALDTFYRAINKVERSLIRTDADELTYNLHVILRFDLELEMLEGRLAVRDLPEAWRERCRADLGVAPPDDRDGVLQDIHWYHGSIGGAFQGYTLGNILSAQFFEAAVRAMPSIPDEIERGEFGTLREWLRTHIHQHGRKFTMPEIVEQATGAPLSTQPYTRYLHGKYAELYAL